MKSKSKNKSMKKVVIVLAALILVVFAIVFFIGKGEKMNVTVCTMSYEQEGLGNVTFNTRLTHDEYVKEQTIEYVYEFTNTNITSNMDVFVKSLKDGFEEKMSDTGLDYGVTSEGNIVTMYFTVNYEDITEESSEIFEIFPVKNVDDIKQTKVEDVISSIEDGGGSCVEE